jgi:hypothetical protein
MLCPAWLKGEAPALLTKAIGQWSSSPEAMAFTERTKVLHADGSMKEERVERFDPSQPDSRRWKLIEVGGIPATPQQREKWESRKNGRPRQKVNGSPSDFLDLDRAALVGETPGVARFRVPVRPRMAHMVSLDDIDVVISVDKAAGTVAGIGAVLREPIPVFLGLVRITDLDVDLRMSPAKSPLSGAAPAVQPGSTAHMTISKLGNSVEYDWSDFTPVSLPAGSTVTHADPSS